MVDKESESVFSKVLETDTVAATPVLTKSDTDSFEAVLKSRRSVRVYDGTPIPEHVVQRCLDLALLAPNSSNLQTWEFYWVQSKEKKSELVKACFSQPAASTAAEIFVCVARPDHWKRNVTLMLEHFNVMKANGVKIPDSALSYYQKLVPQMYNQGFLGLRGIFKKVLLAVAGLSRPVPREPNSTKEMQIWAAKSCALACENLMLSFRAHGFDTCPMEGLDSKRVKKILGLPRGAVVVMAISAGKRAPNGVYGPQMRFDREKIIIRV